MFIKNMFLTRVKILTFIGKLIVIYFIKSKFYVASKFFKSIYCSEGGIIKTKFHLDYVFSMFICKCPTFYLIKSKVL